MSGYPPHNAGGIPLPVENSSHKFRVGEMIFVKKSEEDHVQEGPKSIHHWLAKILEARAGNASRVYLRVYWVYRPEDLPGGRQPYHGGGELIVSNHMDIIEADTLDAVADVVHWNDDLESMALLASQLYYRQSYDITKKTNRLSKLNTYCIDKQPSNPDDILVQCPHCSEWLHAGCLEQRALQDSAKQMAAPPESKTLSSPRKGEVVHAFSAKITADGSKTRLRIMEKHNGDVEYWDVDISCLMCGKMIEKAGDVAPEQLVASTPATKVDEDAPTTKYSAPPPQASGVSDTPIQAREEEDSVIGDDDPVIGDDDPVIGDDDSVIGDADGDWNFKTKAAPTSDADLEQSKQQPAWTQSGF
ncbi:ebs-bah-phd-like protein [Stemphylium lycopersici]|uniref:Ebs-bah-phd-like protein n=1 Tax=Stemphylium lycopersici TaxID=183478 RepID=A0A364NDY6_STELY|nr:ebs-bah-phd-like protein [Stemphylium lycopersici]